MEHQKENLGYQEYGSIIGLLINNINTYLIENNIDFNKCVIYSPPLGGLAIGVHVSKLLNIKFILDFEKDMIENIEYIILVDDIVDTGKTFSEIIFKYKNKFEFITSSLYCKHYLKPEIFLKQVPNNTWVRFPWENHNEKPNRYIWKKINSK